MGALIERLERRRRIAVRQDLPYDDGPLVNPDGPEAAALIKELADTLEKLRDDLAETGAELHAQRIAVIDQTLAQARGDQ